MSIFVANYKNLGIIKKSFTFGYQNHESGAYTMLYKDQPENSQMLELRLRQMKSDIGSNERNLLIEEYRPFIAKQVSAIIGRYLTTDHEDAFMIGMEAFNESIDKYDLNRGSFVNFAAQVIKSRVIDYIRREQRHSMHEIPEEPSHHIFTESVSLSPESESSIEEVKAEIEQFKAELSKYDISIPSLVETSPKHTKTRMEMIRLSRQIASNDAILTKIKTKRHLPMIDITLKYGTSKKVLKSHRDFIIACIIVFSENLSTMKSYLQIRGD